MSLDVGDKAPDFTLSDQDGNDVTLSALLEKGPVVIFFYPADNTPICTRESCAFRDSYADFEAEETEVLGISRDSVESHAVFAERNDLPFPLLADAQGKVHELYGALSLGGLLPKRITFVIGQDGTIQHAFSAQLRAHKHVNEALGAVKKSQ